MFIIKFTVNGQNLILNTDLRKSKVTSDTINYFKCKFTFNSDWDGFSKRVYFKNVSFNITKPAIPDSEGYCFIPWEVLAHTGVILCSVTGVKYSGTDLAERITAGPIKMFVHNFGSEEQLVKKIHDGKATIDPLNVFLQKEEGTLEPDYQLDLTPTEYEQYVGTIAGISEAAEEAQRKAELAERKISNMTASVEMEDSDVEAYVEKIEYEDHYNLNFHLPERELPMASETTLGGIRIDGDGSSGVVITYRSQGTVVEEALISNVQADWNQSISTAHDYIKNKPVILTNEELEEMLT